MSMPTQMRVNNVAQVVQSAYAPAPLQVKFAVISFTGTEQDVVAAVSGKRIRVLSAQFTLTGNADNTAKFWSNGTGGTALTGLLKPTFATSAANMVVLSAADHPYGICETATGEKLTIDGAGTSPVGEGFLTYVEIAPNVTQ